MNAWKHRVMVVLEKTLKSPLGCKEIQPVNLKGNQSWIFIRMIDAEVEAPRLWPPDAKSWLTGKDPDAGKDWRQEEKGTSPTWWTWVWASPKSCWCNNNRKPDLLQSMNCNESDTTEQLNRTDGNNINQWEVKLLCFSSFKEGKLETAEGRRVSSVTENYLTSVTGRV